jgi:hypothetical protein
MTKPVMIRNFFEKISTASAAKAPAQVAAVVTVEIPVELPTEAVDIPVYAPYNDACPPLTTRNSAATRALANDFGVGLPPMAGSFN